MPWHLEGWKLPDPSTLPECFLGQTALILCPMQRYFQIFLLTVVQEQDRWVRSCA